MTNNLHRREFIKRNTLAGIGVAVAPGFLVNKTTESSEVRLGFIGVGGRGTWLLKLAIRRDDVVVNAICDIKEDAARKAQKLVVDANHGNPEIYTAGNEAYKDLVKRDDLDGVIIATPWLWHTIMAVAVMKAGKYAGVEVPAATTLQECWDLVNAYQENDVPCMMLENVCYRRDVMAILNMVRKRLFGELIHCRCGYQHDLRTVKFNPGVNFGPGAIGEAEWRTDHSINRNGDIYPTHGVGPTANFLNINRGNRFLYLTSMATKSRGLHDYIVKTAGENHPHAKIGFKLGDVVTTLIQCANGETVLVTHDTNLPRPYSLGFRVQGTKGIWMKDGNQIYLEGISEPHHWESSESYLQKYDHPLWKKYEEEAAGSGHGGMDFFIVNAFVESVKQQINPPIDVYDAATWSVVSHLSEKSIAHGGEPQDFPDFTKGLWMKRAPVFGLNNEY